MANAYFSTLKPKIPLNSIHNLRHLIVNPGKRSDQIVQPSKGEQIIQTVNTSDILVDIPSELAPRSPVILSYGYEFLGLTDESDFQLFTHYQDSHTFILEIVHTLHTGWQEPFQIKVYFDLDTKIIDVPSHDTSDLQITVEINCDLNQLGIGNQRIPRKLYQTFKDNRIPSRMHQRIDSWLDQNPEYHYHYYSDEECQKMIQTHYNETVLRAYQKLIPGAFKADFWRYCVLYTFGGVYADIPMANLVPLRKIIDPESHFIVPRDTPSSKKYLYNAFMASTPNNPVLGKAIDICIENIENEWYGTSGESICVTGPGVLGRALNQIANRNDKTNFILGNYRLGGINLKILEHLPNRIVEKLEDYLPFNEKPLKILNQRGKLVLQKPPQAISKNLEKKLIETKYPEYYEDRKYIGPHYWYFYSQKQVYSKDIPPRVLRKQSSPENQKIPSRIFQTFEKTGVTPNMWNACYSWYHNNPSYDYYFSTASDRRDFIQSVFGEKTLITYDTLIPGAYKADLWRYCVLYVYGGIYTDIDSTCLVKIDDFLRPDVDCILAIDGKPSTNLSNSFICSVPHNPIFLTAIALITQNVEQRNLGENDVDVSGPSLLGKAVNSLLGKPMYSEFSTGVVDAEISETPLRIHFVRHSPNEHLIYAHTPIGIKPVCNTKYLNYDQERLALGADDWSKRWSEKQVYNNFEVV